MQAATAAPAETGRPAGLRKLAQPARRQRARIRVQRPRARAALHFVQSPDEKGPAPAVTK